MPSRSRRAVSNAPPEHPEPTREALLAALAERERELAEAQARQTATAEILRVISQSPTDARPVFESIVVTAVRLLRCDMAFVLLREGDAYVHTAGATPEGPMADLAPERIPIDPSANFPSRAFLAKTMLHLPDWSQIDLPEHERRIHEKFGVNSVLYLPLLRGDECVGLLAAGGRRAHIFGPSEIAQAESFRDQALIAIKNARLFNETQEALERQTATAEVLKVIAGSPSDVQPVFDVIAASANRLLGGFSTTVMRFVGDALHLVAFTPTNAVADEALQAAFPAPIAEFPHVVLVRDGEAQQFTDTEAQSGVPPVIQELARLRGYRSMLFTPLMSGDGAIGMISVTRKDPGAFAADDVKLLRTFADQAVIAIQNARLFNETQEALEHQKASGEVLRAIAQSVADTTPVFENILDASQRLFGTEEVCIFMVGEDGMVRPAAARGPGFSAARNDVMPLEGSRTGRVIRERRVHHIPDGLAEPGTPPAILERMRSSGNVSIAFAPMLWEDSGLGSIAILRSPPRPFSERELELLRGFADQAAIAIQNARMFRETQEALRQQTATSDILRVIASSPGDLQPVLDMLVETACRLCGAYDAVVSLREGTDLRSAAHYGPIPIPFVKHEINREWPPGRAVVDRRPVHVHDLALAGDEYPVAVALQAEVGRVGSQALAWRSVLSMPLMREGEAVGVITLRRAEVWPFTDAQTALLQTFAAQAVIAIENTRLFEELQARTRDLSEALQQQTATAEVLKVISRSAFDLNLATSTILEAAAKLCRAPLATLHLRDRDVCRLVTQFGLPEAFEREARESPIPVRYPLHSRRPARAGEVAHFSDAWTDPDYLYKATAKLAGYRAIIVIPLMREGELVGIFSLGRPEPDPFTESQIKLTQTFADQAAIAIENARLFNEVKARTEDLSEALQQQTATADVLKAISRTAFDLDTVLETLISTATRLCDAKYGEIFRRHGDVYRYAASVADLDPAYVRHEQTTEIRPGRGTLIGRVALENRTVEIADAWNDPDYVEKKEARLGNLRAMLGVPLTRDGEPIGAFALARDEPVPFTRRQVELVTTFADQAVIAIENVRLFDEVQARTHDLTESLQMQTATSDVLKVISRSAFDLQAVFNTLVSSAVELGGALTGTICVRDGDVFRYRDTIGAEHTSALAQYLRDHPAVPGRSTIAGRVLLSGKVERIPDCLADPEYVVPMGSLASNVRSLLGVPLLRKDGVEGAIILTRDQPGHFSDRQVEIVQTFADQAVIALENVRLFDEVQARTRELAASLDDLRKAQDRLIQSEKLASLGQLTAGIAHEIKNPLNFVNNFSALTRELVDELGETLKRAPLEKGEREEADDLIGTIGANLDKVVSHGKRADSIVKNMLLHSREGSGERTSVNVNAMVEEALNLAYHGARAEKPGFNVTIARSLDDKAGVAELYAQEMTRVLLNLISNGFYATAKRKQGEGNGSYEPTVTASTRDLGHSVEIAIRDNGTGIPDQVKAKMFNPFFTTKPAGEGTGLGLSLSHDIVVKQHGGTLEVSTEPGSFTQFTIVLPRAGAAA